MPCPLAPSSDPGSSLLCLLKAPCLLQHPLKPSPPTPAGVVFNDVYAASKFALEGFFESLAIQLRQFNI